MTTPNGSAHEQWEELAAGYVLDALEPDEERTLLDHLASCADCRRVVDEHAFVASQLAALADNTDIAPPSWSAIRAGIVTDAPVVSLEERRSRRRTPRLLGAAAAAVLLAGAGIAGWQLASDDSGGPDRYASIPACAAAPECHVVRLQGDNAQKAVVLAENGTATVVPTDLPAPPSGHAYALWQLPRDGSPELVTVLRTSTDGASSAAPLVLPYDDTAAFAVSLEPAGTVPTQPTEVIATGTPSA